MILTKLTEALNEVAEQRRALDDVEKQLRSMIDRLSGQNVAAPAPPRILKTVSGESRDRFDDLIDILRDEGKPLHINALVTRYSERTGRPLTRQQLEPGINRHIAKVKQARIAKFSPSTFGLPEWKRLPAPKELSEVA